MSLPSLNPAADYVRVVGNPYPQDDSRPNLNFEKIEFNSEVFQDPVISFSQKEGERDMTLRLLVPKPVKNMTIEDCEDLMEWMDTIPSILEKSHYDHPDYRFLLHLACTKMVDDVQSRINAERILAKTPKLSAVIVFQDVPTFDTPVLFAPGSKVNKELDIKDKVSVIHGKHFTKWNYMELSRYYKWITTIPNALRKIGMYKKQLADDIEHDCTMVAELVQGRLLLDSTRNDTDLHFYP